jgi:hypothetical protein
MSLRADAFVLAGRILRVLVLAVFIIGCGMGADSATTGEVSLISHEIAVNVKKLRGDGFESSGQKSFRNHSNCRAAIL